MNGSWQRWLLAGITICCYVAFDRSAAIAQEKALPPVGIEIDDAVRTALSRRVESISRDSNRLATSLDDSERWKPDVDVLVRAVKLALEQNLFYQPKDTSVADELLDEANRRLEAVVKGKRGLELLLQRAVPEDQPALVVGGFVSRIDDSIQPFGLVIPKGYRIGDTHLRRMDVWLHGRGDNKVELSFLKERMTKLGEYAPDETFVLHPFGRHCNAYKFAGETDVYESIAHAESLFKVDSSKIAMRGFSMGGAGCWHIGVHDPGKWFAVNPGAGFVDTLVYQGWDKKPPFAMSDAQTRLLRWYDVLPWVENFRNTHLVAYSGEVDQQREAAQRVQAEAERLGVPMQHVIGTGMGHKIDKPSATKIDQVLAKYADEVPAGPRQQIDFVTYTLRYPQLDWLRVTGLEQHWEPGRVQAKIDKNMITIQTSGVTSMEIDFGDSWSTSTIPLKIDSERLRIEDQSEAKGFQCRLVRHFDHWFMAEGTDETLRKRPGLQGPIDDAFCDRFLFVVPSRPAVHGVAQRWIDRELQYAQERWRRLMRGEVRVVQDNLLSEHQIATSNLICFGDFSSNRYLARIAHQLPIRWDREHLEVGAKSFDPSTHVAAFCYPNPSNPNRYLVVNSGMTFRDFSNVSNSRQIAMLPDWAVMNVTAEDDSIIAGTVVEEGFFDEQWQLEKSAVDSGQ